jgi:hypothetical protein
VYVCVRIDTLMTQTLKRDEFRSSARLPAQRLHPHRHVCMRIWVLRDMRRLMEELIGTSLREAVDCLQRGSGQRWMWNRYSKRLRIRTG